MWISFGVLKSDLKQFLESGFGIHIDVPSAFHYKARGNFSAG
ncbi:hypothetical protein [Pedobacter endophyticus]|nr:hypothetical protein [Pedobacter endophyticus]